MKRFVWSASFNNEDVLNFYDGFLRDVRFRPVEGREVQVVRGGHWRWIPEQVSEPLTDTEIEECINFLIEGGMTAEEAREFIDACTEDYDEN